MALKIDSNMINFEIVAIDCLAPAIMYYELKSRIVMVNIQTINIIFV